MLLGSGTKLPNLIKQNDISVQRKDMRALFDGYSENKMSHERINYQSSEKPSACNIFFWLPLQVRLLKQGVYIYF